MTLLIKRNHQRTVYNKVLENTAKTSVFFISAYNLLSLLYSFKKGRFFLEIGVIAPNAHPQLLHLFQYLHFIFYHICTSILIQHDSQHEQQLTEAVAPLFYKKAVTQCSIKKCVLENLSKFTGKHQCCSLYFNTIAGLRPATLLKRIIRYKCVLVNFAKFLKTLFFIDHFWWLFLN